MPNVTGMDLLKIAAANPDATVPPEGLELLNGKQAKRNKYGNQWTEFDNHRFQSKAEMRRYADLRLLVMSGHISSFELQPVYKLPGGIKYKGDFRYTENGVTIVEDVKSIATRQNRTFINKWKQCQELYPNVVWRLIET